MFVLFMIIPFVTGPSYGAGSDSEEVSKYIRMLNSTNIRVRIHAAKQISRSGLTDKALFDIINERLQDDAKIERTVGMKYFRYTDEIAWYCKALASSGREEYRETLMQVINSTHNPKLLHHARTSLRKLSQHAVVNKAISDAKKAAPIGQDPNVSRLNGMLLSGDAVSIRAAA